MDRKKALVIASSVTLTVFAGGAAMAANLGLLGAADGTDTVGQLDAGNVADLVVEPVSATQPTVAETTSTTAASPEIVYVDEWVVEPGAPAAGSAPGAAVTTPGAAPVDGTTAAAPAAPPSAGVPSGEHDDPAIQEPTTTTVSPSNPSSPYGDDQYEDEDHEDEDHEDEDHSAEHEDEHEEEDD